MGKLSGSCNCITWSGCRWCWIQDTAVPAQVPPFQQTKPGPTPPNAGRNTASAADLAMQNGSVLPNWTYCHLQRPFLYSFGYLRNVTSPPSINSALAATNSCLFMEKCVKQHTLILQGSFPGCGTDPIWDHNVIYFLKQLKNHCIFKLFS